MKTEVLNSDNAGLARAAVILSDGGLVAFPTETVYGLGADARNDRAVAGIYEAKGRPSFNPLIVHVASVEHARDYVEFNRSAEDLASAFWPGPLTLVVPLRPDSGISKLVTAGNDTLAIRVPHHPVARSLLTAFGGPVAAPSANPSGYLSPTTLEHVLLGLGGKFTAAIDGGNCSVGVESTIVDVSREPVLLRPGGIPKETLEDCIGRPLDQFSNPSNPTAPGQLVSHYATKAPLRLDAETVKEDEVYLGFHKCDGDMNLSPAGDLVEAAANLFLMLHDIDALADGRTIAVARIPMTGLGLAINDRLKRAAAPRP